MHRMWRISLRHRPSAIAIIILALLAVMLTLLQPATAKAVCNPVSGSGVEAVIFGQFASYFGAAENRDSDMVTHAFPTAQRDSRLAGSSIYEKSCERAGKAATGDLGQAILVLEKSGKTLSIFLHSAIFRLWSGQREAIERWFGGGMKILEKSAIGTCFFEPVAMGPARKRLLNRFKAGLVRMVPLCWNQLYSGYAAVIRQDMIAGTDNRAAERSLGQHHLLVRINIKALIE
jgi:hypothetical protein